MIYDIQNIIIKKKKKKIENINIVGKEKNKKIGKIEINIFNGFLAYLENFYVNKKYRNMGYGKDLLKKSINICKKKGAKKISCTVKYDNLSSLKIFTKNGFKKEGVLRNHFQDKSIIIILSKFL